jgi:hypothetical protein
MFELVIGLAEVVRGYIADLQITHWKSSFALP